LPFVAKKTLPVWCFRQFKIVGLFFKRGCDVADNIAEKWNVFAYGDVSAIRCAGFAFTDVSDVFANLNKRIPKPAK